MDATEATKRFKEFLAKVYMGEVLEASRTKKNTITIDFFEVARFDPNLANELAENTDGSLQAASYAMTDLAEFDAKDKPRVRVCNWPDDMYRPIWKIRHEDVDNFISIKGFIRKISDVFHGASSLKFECPSCGNIINVLQLDNKYSEPKQCGCGRKGRFRKLGRELYDLQKIILEEDPSILLPHQKPRRMLILLKYELCRPEIDKGLSPSKKVLISGQIKDEQVKKELAEYKKYMEANNIESLDDSYDAFTFSEEDIKKFKEMASGEIYDDLSQSVFPAIYGNDMAKIAIVLQLFGGVHLYDEGKINERGTIHILLVGSPGCGKTKMLKRAILFIPNSRFTGGRGASGVGLVASVTKDEELGGYTLDAGAIPMCNKSMCGIDEIDKISTGDIAFMNNAMADLLVVIDKANIHATLETDTMILGAANPKNRAFDNHDPVWKQINLPKDFMDRFDLIFPIESMRTEEKMKKVAGMIFSKYKKAEKTEPKYDKDTVIKYIAYARQNFSPCITPEVEEYLTENFINLIKPNHAEGESAYFSTRLLTNLIRLTQAAAKVRLTNDTSIEDAKLAIDIMIDSFRRQEIITPDGVISVEKLEDVVPKNKRDKFYVIKNVIESQCKQNQDGCADILEVIAEVKDILKDHTDDMVEELIEKLKVEGDVFEPKRGKVKLM